VKELEKENSSITDTATTTKSVAVAKKADRTTTYGIATETNCRTFRAGIGMVTWPYCPWLFQTRKFRRFGFSLCVVGDWKIHPNNNCG